MMTTLASVLFTLVGAPPPAPPPPASPPLESPPPSFTQELRVDLGLASAVGFGGVTYSRSVTTGLLAGERHDRHGRSSRNS